MLYKCTNTTVATFHFTGKEKDPLRLYLQSGELCKARLTSPPDLLTGYSYSGARYLEHELMTGWLSVDPMSYKYPSLSPYAYCAWNPVKLIDPEGKDTVNVNVDEGTIDRIKADGDHCIFFYTGGKVVDSYNVQKGECYFQTNSYEVYYLEGKSRSECHNEHLICTNIEVGEIVFKKIASIGSPVEWDYYSMADGYGDLSSSGLTDKTIHPDGLYTAKDVAYWHHYHPYNSPEGFFPSYEDQDHARNLQGIRCTIFFDGRSLEFGKYVKPNKNSYLNIPEFRRLWNMFAS